MPSENGSNYDAKTMQTFTSATSASEARLVRALLRYARPISGEDDPLQSKATHDGTKHYDGTSGPSRVLISWLQDRVGFIRSRPTRAARRRAFQAKMNDEKLYRRSDELMNAIIKMQECRKIMDV